MRGADVSLLAPRINVLLANVRSITNKRESFNSLVDTCNADIIALTETWLHSNVHDSEFFNAVSSFSIYRCDRTSRRGGGVLLAIKKSLQSHVIHVNSELETVWACVEINHRKFIFAVCYRSPTYPPSFNAELHDALNIVTTRHPSAPIFLMGDFNFPNISWKSDQPVSSSQTSNTNEFLDLCSLFNFSQIVTKPTRITNDTANTLDLILTTYPEVVSEIAYLPGMSDHLTLSFEINLPVPKNTRTTKVIHDYARANFEAINSELSIFVDAFIENFAEHSLEHNWKTFKNKVHELVRKYIPSRSLKTNTKTPWYNTYLKRLSNRKKRLYRAAKKCQTSTVRWDAYKAANTEYISAVKQAKTIFFSKHVTIVAR